MRPHPKRFADSAWTPWSLDDMTNTHKVLALCLGFWIGCVQSTEDGSLRGDGIYSGGNVGPHPNAVTLLYDCGAFMPYPCLQASGFVVGGESRYLISAATVFGDLRAQVADKLNIVFANGQVMTETLTPGAQLAVPHPSIEGNDWPTTLTESRLLNGKLVDLAVYKMRASPQQRGINNLVRVTFAKDAPKEGQTLLFSASPTTALKMQEFEKSSQIGAKVVVQSSTPLFIRVAFLERVSADDYGSLAIGDFEEFFRRVSIKTDRVIAAEGDMGGLLSYDNGCGNLAHGIHSHVAAMPLIGLFATKSPLFYNALPAAFRAGDALKGLMTIAKTTLTTDPQLADQILKLLKMRDFNARSLTLQELEQMLFVNYFYRLDENTESFNQQTVAQWLEHSVTP